MVWDGPEALGLLYIKEWLCPRRWYAYVIMWNQRLNVEKCQDQMNVNFEFFRIVNCHFLCISVLYDVSNVDYRHGITRRVKDIREKKYMLELWSHLNHEFVILNSHEASLCLLLILSG